MSLDLEIFIMDFQIWEKAVVAWVNSLISATPEKNFNQINDFVLKDVIKKMNADSQDDPLEFLKNIYPNLLNCDSHEFSTSIDSLNAATLLLIYVSFSNKPELKGLREIMCTQLDNSTQLLIAEFLMSLQKYENVFSISLKTVKQEMHSFVKNLTSQTSPIGDCMKTPVKNNISNNSFDSPLQGFFQTPRKNQQRHKGSSNMCADGDHLKLLKKLTNQLVEEELEKASLQEQLNIYIQKCNENETKLRNKIEEINLLKCEWEIESNKNEVEYKCLKNNIMRKMEDEKKLKNEVSHLEKYVSNLESELTNSKGEKDKLEYQLKTTLGKCLANEAQLKEMTELNMQLKEAIEIKEKELMHFKEEYAKMYKDEKSIDVSFMDGSFDKSINAPENMGVVIEKLLEEKVEENNLLKETVDVLKKEKNSLMNEMKIINEQLTLKLSTITEMEFLNKELNIKIKSLDVAEKELSKVQKELINSNTEICRLLKENCDLSKKCNSLSQNLQEREQALLNSKNSKMLLQANFLKLAEDFKAVLQRLEFEVENISKLARGNFTKLEKSLESGDRIQDSSNQTTRLTRSSVSADKLAKIEELLGYFESDYFEWSDSKTSLEETCVKLNENIVVLRMKITGLKDAQMKSIEEKTELENLLKMSNEKITKMRSLHSCEMKNLKEETDEKEKEVKELQNVIDDLRKFKQNLMFENENLKKEADKLIKENELLLLGGGVFSSSHKRTNNSTNLERRLEQTREQQEFNDSLEEVPFCNKTFDIVNLEEKNINNKTFSIKKDPDTDKRKSGAVWVVSPPTKLPQKEHVRFSERKHMQGESWIVPVVKSKKVSSSVNDLAVKTEPEFGSSLIKASSLSSILEIDYSPPSALESKSSTMSVFSCTNIGSLSKKDEPDRTPRRIKLNDFAIARPYEKVQAEGRSPKLDKRREDPQVENPNDIALSNTLVYEETISDLRRQVVELSKERDHLKSVMTESEQKRKRDKETFEKNQDIIRQNIASKYEAQLEHLKNEMKLLHNRELAKHKSEQSKLILDLREQNKRYKEHIDELRNQLWDLGEKLLQEQKSKRDLERNFKEMKNKFERKDFFRDFDTKNPHGVEIYQAKECLTDENRMSAFRQIPNSTFPIMPTEDEDEVFDNRFLEDMKTGMCKVEKPEGRLLELQYRNSLCLPHLKSSYPGETQFHNPTLFKENEIKQGLLPFGQESQSLTDSDQSLTRSLLPDNKGKKKEQTSYKRPGPPTPSKNGGRLSIQSGDVRLTPRNVLREVNEQSERNKGTPNPLRGLLLSKSVKSLGGKDENTAPVTPRKKSKFFRKPFGAKDH